LNIGGGGGKRRSGVGMEVRLLEAVKPFLTWLDQAQDELAPPRSTDWNAGLLIPPTSAYIAGSPSGSGRAPERRATTSRVRRSWLIRLRLFGVRYYMVLAWTKLIALSLGSEAAFVICVFSVPQSYSANLGFLLCENFYGCGEGVRVLES
jgi:hypothetical protein